METMGRYKLILSLIIAILINQYACLGQTEFDNSPKTENFISTCRKQIDNFQPGFSSVRLLVPLAQNDFSAEFAPTESQVIISRSFIYWALDTLQIIRLNNLDWNEEHLDFTHVTEDQMEVAFLGVLCHEFGHFLQKVFKDRLPDNLGDIDPLLKQQQIEYTCDFISGFTSGKTLWLQIRDALFKNCAGGSTDNLVSMIMAVYEFDMAKLNSAFDCLERFVMPYRNADLLIKGGSCSHGLGTSRKNAFDAGIFYSIYDGIARETFQDQSVMHGLDPFLRILGITPSQLKQTFSDNLTKYLILRKGMTNAISRDLKTYNAQELCVAAFSYCESLDKNFDKECHIDFTVK